jgi:hypothetical protein
MTDSEVLKVEDAVKVIDETDGHFEQIGEIVKIDPPYWPYCVQFPDGRKSWFERDQLEKVKL